MREKIILISIKWLEVYKKKKKKKNYKHKYKKMNKNNHTSKKN